MLAPRPNLRFRDFPVPENDETTDENDFYTLEDYFYMLGLIVPGLRPGAEYDD